MIPTPTPVSPGAVLSVFARLYGCVEANFAATVAQMSAAWTLQNGQQVLGVLGLRPSPAHGAEVMGGAFPGETQHEAALALLQAALLVQPKLYAYAEAGFFSVQALQEAGLHPVSVYTRMAGALPELLPDVPDGFCIVPLSEVMSLEDRLAAQQTYSHRIGHTPVPPDVMQPDFGGTTDALSRLAYDAAGVPAGLCRVGLDGDLAKLGSPGVRSDLYGAGLRQALLLSACEAARAADATRLELEAWGDTEAERAEDQALGLVVEELTPIYSSSVLA